MIAQVPERKALEVTYAIFWFPGGADLSPKTNLLKVIQDVIVIWERNLSILIFVSLLPVEWPRSLIMDIVLTRP